MLSWVNVNEQRHEYIYGSIEVTEWANNTTYGLAANVLTQNVSRSIRMAHALEAGSVYVSCPNTLNPMDHQKTQSSFR